MMGTPSGYEQDTCDSLPFGDDLNCTGSADPSPLHFTGQQHDSETGLDHFPARHYTSAWGLFTSPEDGSGQSAGDPLSWDLYSYVRGNPTSLTDPSGQTYCKAGAEITGGKTPSKGCTSDAKFAKLGKSQGAGCVQVANGIVVTVAGRMPPPLPPIGVAQPGGGYPFLALATAVTRLNPAGFLGDFAIQALVAGAAGPLLGALGEGGEVAEGVAAEGGEGENVTFGHGARHLLGTAVNQAEVEEATITSVQRSVQRARAVGNFWGRVTVDGRVVEYCAAKLADGSINVGAYYVKPRPRRAELFNGVPKSVTLGARAYGPPPIGEHPGGGSASHSVGLGPRAKN